MATKLGIWNEALGILGRMPVSDTGATDEPGRVLTDLWTRVPQMCLEANNWNSAIERVQLQQTDTPPAFGYEYFYQLPRDWSRICRVNTTGDEREVFEDWAEEQDKIGTNASTIYLWYISSQVDNRVGKWSQALADYVAAEMAVRAAPRLGPKLMEYAIDERKRRRRFAMSTDAQMAPPKRFTPGSWVKSRLGGIRTFTDQSR